MSSDHASPPPVVCTLTEAPLRRRALEWTDVSSLSISRTTVEGGASATFPRQHADAVTELANRELDCCGSWMQLATSPHPEGIRLTVTTSNPDGIDIIRGMLGLES